MIRWSPLAIVAAVGGALVALLVVLSFALGLGRLVLGSEGPDRARPESSAPAPATPPPTTPPTGARAPVPDALGPVVRMHPTDAGDHDTFAEVVAVVDGLDPTTVLQVRASGLGHEAVVFARQCVGDDEQVCGNTVRAHGDGDGAASFQYLVADRFTATGDEDGCRIEGPPCYVVLDDGDGERIARTRTVFQDRVPPAGRVRVEPRRDLSDGERVTISVEGLPAGSRLRAALCAAPATSGSSGCGAPGPAATFTVGADGTGSMAMTMRSGPVGTNGARCAYDERCAVAVTFASRAALPAAPLVPVSFAAPPGPDVGGRRMTVGLLAAAVFLAAAAWLIRRSDWSPIGEEAAPEIDEAEYADLDAIIAALPPEIEADDESEAGWQPSSR